MPNVCIFFLPFANKGKHAADAPRSRREGLHSAGFFCLSGLGKIYTVKGSSSLCLYPSIRADGSACTGLAQQYIIIILVAILRESFARAFRHAHHVRIMYVFVGLCCRVERRGCCQRRPGWTAGELYRRSCCSSSLMTSRFSLFPISRIF